MRGCNHDPDGTLKKNSQIIELMFTGCSRHSLPPLALDLIAAKAPIRYMTCSRTAALKKKHQIVFYSISIINFLTWF